MINVSKFFPVEDKDPKTPTMKKSESQEVQQPESTKPDGVRTNDSQMDVCLETNTPLDIIDFEIEPQVVKLQRRNPEVPVRPYVMPEPTVIPRVIRQPLSNFGDALCLDSVPEKTE